MSNLGYGPLLSEGARAPDDVSEVRDSEDRVARIERDQSYPGASRVWVDAPDVSIKALWSLPASAHRPSFYPAELPFISDLSCRVLEGEGRMSATWMGDVSHLRDNEKADGLRASMPEGVAEQMSSIKKRFDDGDELRAEDFKSLHEVFAEDDVQQWMASGEEDLPQGLQDGFTRVLSQLVESGWVEGPLEEAAPSTVVRSAALTRDGRRRVLMLTSALGVGSIILTEKSEAA